MDDLIGELVRWISALEAAQEELQHVGYTHYKGAQAADFNVNTLPNHGDYGYQTTDNEVQMNCNGAVRAITTAAL